MTSEYGLRIVCDWCGVAGFAPADFMKAPTAKYPDGWIKMERGEDRLSEHMCPTCAKEKGI